MRATSVPESAIADALVAAAWTVLAFDALRRARTERPARAALGPVVGAGWRPSRTLQGIVVAVGFGGAAVLEALTGRIGGSPGCPLVGLVLLAAGLVVPLRARRALGPLWSGMIEIRAHHTVVAEGPYAWVRHPIYLGVLLLAAGSLCAHPSPTTACLAGGLALGFALKIRSEERVLRATFGAVYERYAARVPALVPRFGDDGMLAAAGEPLRRLGRL